jgi:hypothetical protein
MAEGIDDPPTDRRGTPVGGGGIGGLFQDKELEETPALQRP